MTETFQEELLAFAEPASISSRSFLVQHYRQPSRDGISYWYAPQTTATVELSGLSQNNFIMPSTFKFRYKAVHNVQAGATGPASAGVSTPASSVPQFYANLPSMPLFGAPHLGSVQCEVPGLSGDLSLLTSDGASQRFYNARLMTCSGEAKFDVAGDRTTMGMSGRVEEAGGKSSVVRSSAVFGRVFTDRADLPASAPVGLTLTGSFIDYAVPCSAWLTLGNQTSCALALPYLTQGSSNLIVRANFAPISSACVTHPTNWENSYGQVLYWVTGVELAWSAVNVLDSRILRSIQALFTGQLSIPLSPQLSIPVPMVLGHKAFRSVSQTYSGDSFQVSLRIPAGVAAAEAVLFQLLTTQSSSGRVVESRSWKNWLSAKYIVKDLQLRIGSATFPARMEADLTYPQGSIIPGTGTARPLLLASDPANPINAPVGAGPMVVGLSREEAQAHTELGKQFYSLFDDDPVQDTSALTCFTQMAYGSNSPASFACGDNSLIGDRILPKSSTNATPFDPEGIVITSLSPNLYLLPLNSFPSRSSPFSSGYGITGIDLRNQSDIILECRVEGVVNSDLSCAPATSPDYPQGIAATTTVASAWLAHSELVTILPGRVDLRASMSLLPSAASTVPAGGSGAL